MRISVIIPTLNEASCVEMAIASVRAENACEIVVVDGGSSDGTVEKAAGADVVVVSRRGRGAQMNTGARYASGEIFLFLHADCTLEPGWMKSVQRALAAPRTIAGCFSMATAAQGVLYRCIDWCGSTRVRLAGIVYGDQGLFLRRDTFNQVGGFPAVQFMEDVLLSKTLRALGRVEVLSQKVFVSPRRWEKSGVIRQTLRNWTLTALAGGGVHPDKLARFYPRVR